MSQYVAPETEHLIIKNSKTYFSSFMNSDLSHEVLE